MSQSNAKFSELVNLFGVSAADSIINEALRKEAEAHATGILFKIGNDPEMIFIRLRCDYCGVKCGKESKCLSCGAPL